MYLARHREPVGAREILSLRIAGVYGEREYRRLEASLAVTGGVHTDVDIVKSVMAGADAVQLVSALLQNGPEYLTTLREDLERWLVEHEYESLNQMRGSMNLENSPNPAAYERANYMRALTEWSGRPI